MLPRNSQPRSLSSSVKILIIILAIILGLAGCGRRPQQGFPGGAAPAVVEIWHSLPGAEADALKIQVARIMDAHPEVIIKLEYIPEEKLPGTTFQAQAGGEGPDIFISTREVLHKLYSQGALAPVLATGSDAFPAVAAGFKFGDKLYAQPWLTDVPLFFYRADMVQPPAGLTDIINSKGVLVLPALNTALIGTWWNGQGGKILSGGKPALDDPGNLIFLQQLLNWRDAKQLQVNPDALTLFTGGLNPYMIGWASQSKVLNQMGVAWGSVPLSKFLAGQGQAFIGTTWGMANSSIKSTEQLSPAIRIVEETLISPEVEGALSQVGSLAPASASFYRRPEAQQGIWPQVNKVLADAWAIQGNSPEWKLIPLQDAAWRTVILGNTSPQDALNKAQSEALKVLGIQ